MRLLSSIAFALASFAIASATPVDQPQLFDQQCGGHGCIIVTENGICKPTDLHATEQKFYQTAEKYYPELYNGFMAEFYSVKRVPGWTLETANEEPLSLTNKKQKKRPEFCIEIGNLLEGFSTPSQMDLKMGSRLYDHHASPEKQKRLDQAAIDSTSSTLGMRIVGMKVRDQYGNTESYEKKFGLGLTEDTFDDGFNQFFAPSMPEERKVAIVSSIYEQVERLMGILSEIEGIRMYAASLFIVYDSDMDSTAQPIVKLIDFGHSYFDGFNMAEDGVMMGLRNFQQTLQNILDMTIEESNVEQ